MNTVNPYTIDDLFNGTTNVSLGTPSFFTNPPSSQNSFTDGVDPSTIAAGELQANTVVQDGYLQSSNYVANSTGWRLSPTGADINGGVAVDSLDVPDTTTTNSFHVDSSGNIWSGANTAATYSGGKAYIKNDGTAYFQNIKVGGTTYQYTMNDQGIYTFGDGSDSAVAFDGTNDYTLFATKSGANYYLTRDVFATNITISNNVFVYPSNYRIFCQGTFTLSNGGQLLNDGNAASGTTGATANAAGYLSANIAGVNGGGGGAGWVGTVANGDGAVGTTGTTGNSVSNSLSDQGGSTGSRGGDGGVGAARAGGSSGGGGVAGTRTYRNIKPALAWNFMSFFDINADGTLSKYRSGVGGGSGGGGGGGGGEVNTQGGNGGQGGGSGATGGIIFISARNLVISAGSNIFARGGAGGTGANGTAASWISGTTTSHGGGGGGGGGAGGNGGILFLIYNTITNAGTITLSGGAGGAAGTGGAGIGTSGQAGSDGLAGSSGATGTQILIQMAL